MSGGKFGNSKFDCGVKEWKSTGVRGCTAQIFTPRVCATCRQFTMDDGSWDCKKRRASGDTGDMDQWQTRCRGWRRFKLIKGETE